MTLVDGRDMMFNIETDDVQEIFSCNDECRCFGYIILNDINSDHLEILHPGIGLN